MSNHRGNLLIILSIVLLIVVAGAGVHYFNITKQNEQSPSLTTSTIQTVTPSPALDDTVSWQTYTDNKLKFFIKHPEDIVVIRSFADSEGGVVFARAKESKKDFRSITTLDIYFRGEVGTTPEQALKNECSTRIGEGCQEKYEAVHINNAVGIRTLGPNYPNDNNYYLIGQNGKSKVVRLGLFPESNDLNEDLRQFKKMIQTFAFLN